MWLRHVHQSKVSSRPFCSIYYVLKCSRSLLDVIDFVVTLRNCKRIVRYHHKNLHFHTLGIIQDILRRHDNQLHPLTGISNANISRTELKSRILSLPPLDRREDSTFLSSMRCSDTPVTLISDHMQFWQVSNIHMYREGYTITQIQTYHSSAVLPTAQRTYKSRQAVIDSVI